MQVCLYISSSGTDSSIERRIVHEVVTSRLHHFCRERDLCFEIIDFNLVPREILDWPTTHDVTELLPDQNHTLIDLRHHAMQRSQNEGLGPKFMVSLKRADEAFSISFKTLFWKIWIAKPLLGLILDYLTEKFRSYVYLLWKYSFLMEKFSSLRLSCKKQLKKGLAVVSSIRSMESVIYFQRIFQSGFLQPLVPVVIQICCTWIIAFLAITQVFKKMVSSEQASSIRTCFSLVSAGATVGKIF